MPRIPRFAVALATLLALAAPRPARAGRAYVVESDFSAGSFSAVNTATHVPACDVASIHSDARVRWYDGRVYVVNRAGADNIEVLDGTTYALVKQFSVGTGSNPYDIAFASATHAYVTRYESTDLWVVDPTTGAHTGTVSLAALADADGIPEMDHLEKVGPWLFVSLQRVDRNHGFQPTDTSLVAVIDTRTDQLVDCDPAAPGVQGIRLPRTNPVTPFVFDEPRTRLYLGCAGVYGVNDGGIVRIDPVALRADGVVAPEDSLGGDVLDLAWHDDGRAYAVISDPAFNTSLVRWSPVTGRSEATLYAPGGFSIADAEVTPDGSEVWACNSTFGSPGIHVFATGTGQPVGLPITCTLPPQGLTFDAPTNQVAGVESPGAAMLAAPWPNPARSSVRLFVPAAAGGDARLEVLDVAGRRVRAWTRAAGAAAGEIVWNLTDDAGRKVRAGIYLARLTGSGATATRRIVVIE